MRTRSDSAYAVYGGIFDCWNDNKLADGPLGFPLDDEKDYCGEDAKSGDRVSRFEGGIIVWRKADQSFECHLHPAGKSLNPERFQTPSEELEATFNCWEAREAQFFAAREYQVRADSPEAECDVVGRAQYEASQEKWNSHLHGVNLGGWLVLERWMKESLFAGVKGKDETCFCVQLGREEATRRLREHWDTWIAEADFEWIAAHGFNAVRIPVGHWIFGAASGYPYHERYGADPHPYVDGGIERLDRAFDWAEKHGLMVLVDLHCAPGCQNGFDNGGLEDVCDWYKKPEYVDFTVLTLERLAERYGKRKALWGIETLNEPHCDKGVPVELLLDFDKRAYGAIRKHCSTDVAVVIHDGFLGGRIFERFDKRFVEPDFRNVVLDAHRYYCFTDDLKHLSPDEAVHHAETSLANELQRLHSMYWTILGEWSLAASGDRDDRKLNGEERQKLYRAQVKASDPVKGQFFWSYKLENGDPAWSLRDAVEKGLRLLPAETLKEKAWVEVHSTTTLEERVKQIVVDSLHAEASAVKPDASFVNDLGADSIDQAELMMNIEDAFKPYVGDNIPAEDAAKFETVGSVIEFLKSKGVPECFKQIIKYQQ